MKSLRISFVCLSLAIASGGLSLLPRDLLTNLPETWDGALRGLCIAALVGFAVSFMMGLARALQNASQGEGSGIYENEPSLSMEAGSRGARQTRV